MSQKTKKPKLSVIISLYNAEKEIGICLDSIFNSDWKDFEVIIVDDCSTDNSLKIAKKYPCRFFSLDKNGGPAKARNLGVSKSKADITLFLDSDTKVEKDSLRKIYETFIKKKDILAVIVLPAIDSLRKGHAPDYNALKNQYTLYSANPYCDYFTTQMGAIRKKIFKKVGGFDERFKSPVIEDIEFGMKLSKRKIFINKKVIIGHHFPFFGQIFKKYLKRAFLFTEVVKTKKRLNSAHTTSRWMISVILALVNFILLLFSWLNPLIFFLFLFSFLLFFLFNIGLFKFAVQKRGALYLFETIFFEYVFSIAIGMGGVVGVIYPSAKKTEEFIKKYINLTKIFFSRYPTYIIFYVTAICNSRCKTCFNWKYNTKKVLKDELTIKEIQKISKKYGYIQYLTLGGGEPFLRKDIDEIARVFYKNNKTKVFSIPTNCLTPKLIADKTEKMLKKCPNAIFRVSISIDGIGKLHDFIRGVKGNFKKVEETYNLLENLRSEFPNLEILANTTFNSYNQDHIKEIHDYIRKNFKLDMYGLTLVRGNARELVAKKIDLNKYKSAIKLFEKSYFKNKGKMRHPLQRILTTLPIFTRRDVLKTAKSKKRTYKCYAIKKHVVLDSFGNVFACEMLPNKLGNLRDYNYNIKKI